MLITQFMLEGLDDKEAEQVISFIGTLRDIYCAEFCGNIMKLKISMRIKYLYEVPWIKWKTKNITPNMIVDTIYRAIRIRKQDLVYMVYIDKNVLIPNTYTSIDRLMRFLDYGDLNYKGLGIFTKLEHKYNYSKLNALWVHHIYKHLGYLTTSKIIGVQ